MSKDTDNKCGTRKPAHNLVDLQGKRFGNLTVLQKGAGRFTSGGAYKCTWLCKCDCGKEIEVDAQHLKRGHTTSCGCKKHSNKGSHFEDLTGKRFGRLTVLYFMEQKDRSARQFNWMCKCECGNMKKASANKLKNGLLQSCGCLKKEMEPRLGQLTRRYVYSNKRLYSVYKAMIDRCTNPESREWENYGGRGITVCPEWMKSYDAFAEWALKSGYDEKAKHGECTIDRIDVNKGYEPDNCTFVPNKKQQNNRRNNVYIEYNGECHTMKEWSEIFNIPYGRFRVQYRVQGKSIEEIIGING